MDASTTLAISFIVYSLFIIGTGLYSTKLRKETDADFVLANRELGPWASALSASASSESGWVMLGLVGLAFSDGLSALWIVPGIGLGYLFNWFVLAERLRKSTATSGAVTLPQYICHRFGANSAWLRLTAVIIITASMLGYVAAQMNAAGKAFGAVFELPYWLGVLIGAVIVLAYTITGGFRAVCWTDIVQGSFMVIALIGMPIVLYAQLGSMDNFAIAINKLGPDLLTPSGGRIGYSLAGFVIGMIGIGLGYPGQPHVLSRFMAARDFATVKIAGVVAFFWFILVYMGAIIFGMFARAYYANLADPEQALPIACGDFLPPILGGFVIAAIVSAICSTADSQLIVVSSAISRDVIPWFGKGKNGSETDPRIRLRKLQRLDKWVLIVLAVFSVLFALTENRVIFEFVLYAWSALGAAFGPVVILGLMWKKANKSGAIAGMITGLVVTVVWKNVPVLKGMIYELVPAFVLSFIAVIVFSLVSERKSKQL
jgi:sodium/proline symporter